MLKLMMDDNCANGVIPLPNVSGKTMSLVVEYSEKLVELADAADGDFMAWEAEFISQVDSPVIFDLILAANYLDIKTLQNVSCQKVADSLKDKTPEEDQE